MALKYYLAGPMSGIPKFNYPAFTEATRVLRSQGYDVITPTEQDPPETQALMLASETGDFKDLPDNRESWGDMLARDVKFVADDVDGVIVLPGWEKSRGARLEAFVAATVGKPVMDLFGLEEYDMKWLMNVISNNMVHRDDESRYEGA